MRINWSDDEDFPGQFELWQANCERSLKSKKGQAALRELEAALLALPTKRLIAGELDDGQNCCAIGALVRHKGVTPKADPEYEMEEIGEECGMPRMVAWKTVEMNDYQFDEKWESPSKDHPHGRRVEMTPEERYEAMLAWVRKCLLSSEG